MMAQSTDSSQQMKEMTHHFPRAVFSTIRQESGPTYTFAPRIFSHSTVGCILCPKPAVPVVSSNACLACLAKDQDRLLVSLSENHSRHNSANTLGSHKYRKLQKNLEKRNEPCLPQIEKMVLKSSRAKQWYILIQSGYLWINSALTCFPKVSAQITEGTLDETSTTHSVPKRKQQGQIQSFKYLKPFCAPVKMKRKQHEFWFMSFSSFSCCMNRVNFQIFLYYCFFSGTRKETVAAGHYSTPLTRKKT